MATNDVQFTSLSMDPRSNAYQPTSSTGNIARAQMYNENR